MTWEDAVTVAELCWAIKSGYRARAKRVLPGDDGWGVQLDAREVILDVGEALNVVEEVFGRCQVSRVLRELRQRGLFRLIRKEGALPGGRR